MSPSIAGILAVVFFSTLVRALLGFGNALIAMPLLAFFVSVKTAAPLVALVAGTVSLCILVESWQSVELKSAWQLIVSSCVGIPVGVWLLKRMPEGPMQAGLAVLILAFALYGLWRPPLTEMKSDWAVYLFGFVSGVLGGAYNTNGPPAVVYGTLRKWSPERFRATLLGFFLPTTLVILAVHGAAGFWTGYVLRLYVVSLPLVLVAVFVGTRLSRKIPQERFYRVVYVFLLVIGAYLLLEPVRH